MNSSIIKMATNGVTTLNDKDELSFSSHEEIKEVDLNEKQLD